MEANPKCSLDDMLSARDRRREWQQRHFEAQPAMTLVVSTVVAPGEHKLTRASDIVAEAMAEALRARFAPYIISMVHHVFVSGHEIWLTLTCGKDEAKRAAVEIEDSHALGRLFDIDVILPELRPLCREDIGTAPRRCLLCDNEARYCMRLRLHTPQDIRDHIENLVKRYADGRR